MKTLNKTFIFTDAHISKSIYKEKVELSLSAIDIFHQRKHVQFVMNGEGHIETMATQYIPAYVLASIRFNWSLSSKRKGNMKLLNRFPHFKQLDASDCGIHLCA